MNREPMTLLLAGALLVSVTATAGLCYWYLQSIRQHQQAQEVVARINQEVARVNRNKAIIQSLASESIEYSKKNPAILPILQNIGIRPRGDTNGTPEMAN